MIIVFRYGHRIFRDKRISTHVALVARAFMANKIIYCGDKDNNLEKSIQELKKNFGNDFQIEYCEDWKKKIGQLKNSGFKIVHLTMYGEAFLEKKEELKKESDLVVFVGSQKVPSEIYKLADYNISITFEPHSEVAALAIFLNEVYEKKPLEKESKNKQLFQKILRLKIKK